MLILKIDWTYIVKSIDIQYHLSPRRFYSVNAQVDSDGFKTKFIQIAAFYKLADAIALQDKLYEAAAQDEDFDVNEFCISNKLSTVV